MQILTPYIPKEYLALRINYCRQQLAGLPEVVIKQRKIRGVTRTIYASGKHIAFIDSKNGENYCHIMQKREELLCNLAKYEGMWNSNYKGTPPEDIKPGIIRRSFLSTNAKQIVINSDFFENLPNDANPYYPDSKKYFYNGTYYRSNAEREIAHFYTEQGIPFKYEPEIWLSGMTHAIYPDFVVLIKELDLCKLHEHFGMTDYSNYARATQSKYQNYSSAGLVMDLDVICTYSLKDIPFDLRMLGTKLNNAVLSSLLTADGCS